MYTIEELQHLIQIDRDHLEEELIRQPQLFWEVSEYFAEAISKRDLSKQVLEHVEADLANQFRSKSLEKVSDKKTTDHVLAHPMYVQQYQTHLSYKAQADKLGGLKDAYAQRVSMLRDLVTLANMGYWGSGVEVKPDIETYKKRYQERAKST